MTPQFGASLTVVNYAPNIFIIQATVEPVRKRDAERLRGGRKRG